jgi:hypothetical protein
MPILAMSNVIPLPPARIVLESKTTSAEEKEKCKRTK